MRRRTFIQSLAAAFTLPAIGPALSVPAASSAVSASAVSAGVAVPAKARFWAIYMSSLHGECTPQTLQNLLHIPGADAKKYIGQLIADGIIKPNPLLQRTATELVKSRNDNLLEKVKKRSEMKAHARADKLDVREPVHAEVDVKETAQSQAMDESATESSTKSPVEHSFETGMPDEHVQDQIVQDQLLEGEPEESIDPDREIIEEATAQASQKKTRSHS